MAFEKFTDTSKSHKPRASIRANGTIALNSATVRKFSLSKENAPYFILLFDRDTSQIGIYTTTSDAEDGAHQVHYGASGASFSATRFLDFFGITPGEKAERAEVRKEGEMLLFKITSVTKT